MRGFPKRRRTGAGYDTLRRRENVGIFRAEEFNRKIAISSFTHPCFAGLMDDDPIGRDTIDPALDLIKKVDRPNVGVMFNLCHFLKGEKHQDLETTIERAGSKIFAVSTCGADRDGRGWNVLIQPLDQGSFKQARLFDTLRKINFRGAVGIQCYAVKGDKKSNLQRSMKAWREILTQTNK